MCEVSNPVTVACHGTVPVACVLYVFLHCVHAFFLCVNTRKRFARGEVSKYEYSTRRIMYYSILYVYIYVYARVVLKLN